LRQSRIHGVQAFRAAHFAHLIDNGREMALALRLNKTIIVAIANK
jgi:hypothetical protein